MKEQEQALEKIKNNCHSMRKKIEDRMDNESAELLTTMQLRLEVNESYIMKQKKLIEKVLVCRTRAGTLSLRSLTSLTSPVVPPWPFGQGFLMS